MSLADIADIQVTTESARVARAGFGVPLILSPRPTWVERIRSYEDLAGMVTDGFTSSTPEYKAAAKMFAQEPSPSIVKIGRCANKPTQRWAITPVAANGATYRFWVNDVLVEYVAGTMIDLPYTAQSANFHAGRTVTGGTSGAKGIILTDTDGGTTGTLRLVGVRGTFQNGEALAEDGSGPGAATAGTPAAVTGVNATVAEIVNGLRSKLDGVITDATPDLDMVGSDQTTYLRVLSNTAGGWFGIRVEDVSKLGIAQDHADPGVQDDLDAIANESKDWYGLIHLFNSKACVDKVAEWVEANGPKIFVAATQDSAVITTASSGTDDVGESLAGHGYARTAAIYHPDNGAFADAAWAGACLPLDPGSETWMFKNLAGVTAFEMTTSQRSNARAKYVNYYEKVGINSFTAGGGIVSANEFVDVIRFRDWLEARLGEDWLALLLSVPKVPYTREGGVMVEGLVRNRLRIGVEVGGLAADPEPSVTVPEVKDVAPELKEVRNFGPVKFTADLAGAIHKLTLRGVLNF
jgi:hypothetical protein